MVGTTTATDMNDSELMIPDVPLAQVEEDFDDREEGSVEARVEGAKTVLNLIKDSSNNNNSRRGDSDSDTDPESKLSCSLEDLVECFDQKVNHALKDLGQNTTHMAPVQIRTQDEIMSESQVWWTLTGNYGNILPLDFSSSQIRKNQIEALNLSSSSSSARRESAPSDAGYDPSDEEETMRQSLDLHQLISQQSTLHADAPPVSADQVIEEIDEIMQTCDLMHSMNTDRTLESVDSMYSSMRSPFTSSSQHDSDAEYKIKNQALTVTAEELSRLPHCQLLALMAEMEQLIMVYNAELVSELACRDEQVYEKEVKNKFITLLVNIQEARRKHEKSGKKKKLLAKLDSSNQPSSQFMTASIPFDEHSTVWDVPTLESMIKILEAINEDSPQMPSLLTDYILNVVCPSTETSMIAP